MARPDTTLAAITSQAGNWDESVDDNNTKLRELTFLKPYPAPIVHVTTGDSGSVALATFPAADYKWCIVIVVDAASPATNGYMAMSNGTNWQYVRTGTNV